jgi:pimeloyl-ACP methyl ester carboxylesterase
MPRRLLPLLAVVAVLVPAAPALAAVPKGPSGARFYTPPKKLPGHKHGDLIRARTVHGVTALRSASSTKLVLYRSTGSNGKPIAVSGLVSVPKGHAPKGGWPVVSWAHGTVGIGDACAPSRDTAKSSSHDLVAYVAPLLNRYLKAGFAVVRTDYQGLGTPGVHEFLVGREEGRSVLDMVRAARQLDKRISRRTLIAGHSQGGQSALYAASLAKSWTPDLKLGGTVAFAPVSHLDTQAGFVRSLKDPSPLTGLVALIARGIDTDKPSLHVRSLLGTDAAARYPQTLKRCLPGLRKGDSYGPIAPADFFRADADISPVLTALGKSGDPEHLRIRTPVLIEQGTADSTVFQFTDDALVDEYRKRGNPVTYTTYDGVDHGGIVVSGAGESLKFLKAHR